MKSVLLTLLAFPNIFGALPFLNQSHAKQPAAHLGFASIRVIGGDERKIALGRDLFFDRRLSPSMRLNCASCHDLSTNGASINRIDRDAAGKPMPLNTPTVFNSIYSFRFGWRGEVRTMRDEVLHTLRTALLDNGVAAHRLEADPAMTQRFRAIYRAAPKESSIVDALSAFTTTLVTPNAPFDRWLEGDAAALTAQQVRGYALFVSLGCAGCHQGQNVGANIVARRGVFHPLGDHPMGDTAPRSVRVPSLRNVAVTAPYFHDGSVSSLPFAIRQMAWSQLDRTLHDREVADIAAFLRSLTGTYEGHPLRAPASRRR